MEAAYTPKTAELRELPGVLAQWAKEMSLQHVKTRAAEAAREAGAEEEWVTLPDRQVVPRWEAELLDRIPAAGEAL